MKKWAFILCCILSLGFVLVGCGNNDFVLRANDELYFNGPSATIVGDYLYFGNGMNESYTTTDSLGTTSSHYNEAKGLAYLARLNVNAEKLSSKGKDYSPKGVSTIGNEVATYTNSSGIDSFVFAIGNYVFYATPNTWQTSDGQFNFGWTTIYGSKRDGSDKKEIYSTRDLKATVTKIEVLKYAGKFYLMMLANSNSGEGYLIKLNLASGNAQVLSGVTSVAMPKTYQQTRLGSTTDWNGILYYTKNSKISDQTYNDVYKVSITDMTEKNSYNVTSLTGSYGTVTFIDREVAYVGQELVDEIFFTGNGSKTYKMTISESATSASETEEGFYNISDFASGDLSGNKIYKVLKKEFLSNGTTQFASNNTYVYASAGELHFVSDKWNDKVINFVKEENGEAITFNQVVSVDETRVVLLGTNDVYTADISSVVNGGENKVNAKTVVTMETGIFTDRQMFAYDRDYVYYYAKLNPVDSDENDPEGKLTGNDDANYYFCRSSLTEAFYGEDNYQFLGVTQTKYRRS